MCEKSAIFKIDPHPLLCFKMFFSSKTILKVMICPIDRVVSKILNIFFFLAYFVGQKILSYSQIHMVTQICNYRRLLSVVCYIETNRNFCSACTPQSFSTIFSKGDNFHNFLFAYLEDKVFQKWDLLLKERICSSGSKFHSLRLDPEVDGRHK